MTVIDVDTIKLRECGKDLLNATISYSENVDDLFERVSKVPTMTKEWVGEASNNYAINVGNEKTQYSEYGLAMKNFGDRVMDYADSIELAVKNTRIG